MNKKKIAFTKNKIYMLPVGGCGHFGANMTFYGLNGKWIAIDCGAAFADEKKPGVDLLMPNILNIPRDIIDNLQAIFITHAHEDHIGGMPRLWGELGFPDIYCTAFAKEILKAKFKEVEYPKNPVYKSLKLDQPVCVGDINVQPVPVSHSIPEAHALFLQTPYGTLLHSGDWNMDETPVMPFETEEKIFRSKAGDNGVLAYIGDSTNAESKGHSPSESWAAKGLLEAFSRQQGRIVVTLFSSNIARIDSICRAAEATGRRVCVAGRSVETMVRAAISCGYLSDVQSLISTEDMGYLPENEQVYIVTGSQGEARATLAKVARGAHRHISLDLGDCVMFSARKIPGNERAIQDVMNDFLAAGIQVITPNDENIHVSGHPYGGEIANMLEWVRPEIIIPVHGEKSQITAQAKIAKEHQIKTLIPDNGALIEIDPECKTAKILCDYDCELRPVVFGELQIADYLPLKERRRISFHGCVFVSINIDENSHEMIELQMSSIGLLDMNNESHIKLYEDCLDEIERSFYALNKSKRGIREEVEHALSVSARRFFRKLYNIKPNVKVHALIN